MLISGVMICQNEQDRILDAVKNIYDYVDEFIILDGGSKDNTVGVLRNLKNGGYGKLKIFQNDFNLHFGDQKNLALSKVKAPWVLNIDADETFGQDFLNNIEMFALQNETHCYAFPRLNTLDGKKTNAFPDYQYRFFRAYARFLYAVHEELMYQGDAHLFSEKEEDSGFWMTHHKSSAVQAVQNQRYDGILKTHLNFLNSHIDITKFK